MKKYLRPLGLILVLGLLAGGAYAASSEDSLISLSYLQSTFFPKAVQAGEEKANQALQEVYDRAKGQLDALHGGGGGGLSGSYSDTLQRRQWTDGQAITLSTGSGVLMLEGSASLAHNGAVVDVTTGAEVPSGGRLSPNHRYLVGEDTAATVTVRSGQAALGVQGSYALSAGKDKHTPFYDVSQIDWFYEPVGYAYEKGLFSGVDAGHFAPEMRMNRAMLMTVLYSLAGSPGQTGSSPFADVPNGDWYTSAVLWGTGQGIASGVGDGLFSPNGEVTREQTVLMLYNYASKYLNKPMAAGADLSGYGDVGKLSSWAQAAMSWAVGQGIVSGADNGGRVTLEPQRGASRAEMATMLRAFCEKIL